MEPDFVRVAYGTHVTHEWRRVIINPDTRQGSEFDIRETTYFYGANTSFELPKDLEFLGTKCSNELLFQIRSVVEEYDAAIEEL